MSAEAFLRPEPTLEFVDRYVARAGILKAINEVLPRFKGVLLDVGCGAQPYRSLFVSAPTKVRRYIGLDMFNSMYQSGASPDLFWNGREIPLRTHSVDCAVATEVFEHVPDLLPLLIELRRVLNAGGVIFFTVPFFWPLHDSPHDEYRYTPFALRRLLRQAGFGRILLKALGTWDASLAQMIGLWLRRRTMSAEERQHYSNYLFPVFKMLIQNDIRPQGFSDGDMITGITGIAVS
jgi:SAM-dependent methyltransferase